MCPPSKKFDLGSGLTKEDFLGSPMMICIWLIHDLGITMMIYIFLANKYIIWTHWWFITLIIFYCHSLNSPQFCRNPLFVGIWKDSSMENRNMVRTWARFGQCLQRFTNKKHCMISFQLGSGLGHLNTSVRLRYHNASVNPTQIWPVYEMCPMAHLVTQRGSIWLNHLTHYAARWFFFCHSIIWWVVNDI